VTADLHKSPGAGKLDYGTRAIDAANGPTAAPFSVMPGHAGAHCASNQLEPWRRLRWQLASVRQLMEDSRSSIELLRIAAAYEEGGSCP
jgi:hypothetical protein